VTISIINACILVEGVFEGKKEQSLGNQTFISVCEGLTKKCKSGRQKEWVRVWRANPTFVLLASSLV